MFEGFDVGLSCWVLYVQVSLCFWVHPDKACVESLASHNYNANKDGCFSSTLQTKGLFCLGECLIRTDCLLCGSVEIRQVVR